MEIAQEQGRGPGNEVTPSGNWSEDATELLTACIKAFVIFSTVTDFSRNGCVLKNSPRCA